MGGKIVPYIDRSGSDIGVNDIRYLKLDQTTPQSVINGIPNFSGIATQSINAIMYEDDQVSFANELLFYY